MAAALADRREMVQCVVASIKSVFRHNRVGRTWTSQQVVEGQAMSTEDLLEHADVTAPMKGAWMEVGKLSVNGMRTGADAGSDHATLLHHLLEIHRVVNTLFDLLCSQATIIYAGVRIESPMEAQLWNSLGVTHFYSLASLASLAHRVQVVMFASADPDTPEFQHTITDVQDWVVVTRTALAKSCAAMKCQCQGTARGGCSKFQNIRAFLDQCAPLIAKTQ